jgi:hypothetical protein
MGRGNFPEHYQWVLDDWRCRLLAVAWRRGGGGNAQMLAVTIGIDSRASDSSRSRRLREAAKVLLPAIAAASEGSARPDALDAWIDQHLVRRGRELLISEGVRRTALARARDVRRRQTHADRGLRSARIEMLAESWAKLEAIRAELGAGTVGKVTLGAALEHIIAAYGSKPLSSTPNRARGRKQAGKTGIGDLFGPLNTEVPD